MNLDTLDTQARPRRPQQERSRRRFEAILDAAEGLLEDQGLSGFSIPVLAEKLDFNRRTIYALFPTPYAILNELTARHIQKLEQDLKLSAMRLKDLSAASVVPQLVFAASRYHNEHAVARLLILGGAVTDRSFRANEETVRHLGRLGENLLRAQGITVPEGEPDIPVLAVELGLACMRLSQSQHGYITVEYAIESAYCMLLYLNARLPGINMPDRKQISDQASEALAPAG